MMNLTASYIEYTKNVGICAYVRINVYICMCLILDFWYIYMHFKYNMLIYDYFSPCVTAGVGYEDKHSIIQ